MYETLTHNDLIKLIEEYKHRIAMIKDDVTAIYRSVESSDDLCHHFQTSYGGYVPDTCLRNIEIACDLSSDECLEWTSYANLLNINYGTNNL